MGRPAFGSMDVIIIIMIKADDGVSGKCGLERTRRIRTRTRTRRHQYYDTEMVVTMAVCSVLKSRGALMETS